jgi:ABC-type polysaccharide/polyol phosphate export permease
VAIYADLVRYRDLFLNLFSRDLRGKYKGSFLGLAWTLVYPLVLIGVYTLVFSVLLRAVQVDHFPLFVVSGLVTWIFFQASLQGSTLSLLGQGSLIKQVRFPRQLLPLSVVATNLVTLLVMLAVVLPFNLVIVPDTRTTFWLVLPLLLPLVALVSGLAIVFACANVLFRDIEHLLATIFLPWFFLTPIFYTFADLLRIGGHRWIVQLLHWGNFVTPIVNAIRDPLFFGRMPFVGDVIYSVVAGAVALLLGALVFSRIDDQLAAEL